MFKFLLGVAFGAAGYWAWQSFGRDLLGLGSDQDAYGGFSSTTSGSSFNSGTSGTTSYGSSSTPSTSTSPSTTNASSPTESPSTTPSS